MKNHKLLILLLLIIPVLASGCVSLTQQLGEQMSVLPGRYASFDLKLGLEVKKAGEQVSVEGVVKNTRYAFMEDLEIWITPQDISGKSLARSVSYFIPGILKLDDYAQFSVKFPVTATPIAKLLFTYRYTGNDGGDKEGGGAIPWMNSFVANLDQ
ncbi:MAG: hypothetical protein A2079_06495 [Geobacteraceae bacterium GWC2_48_7]|nr:MAG: hypothetical protein A2079_06495 [Geobacteraceae bacterium GWC2_48_7]